MAKMAKMAKIAKMAKMAKIAKIAKIAKKYPKNIQKERQHLKACQNLRIGLENTFFVSRSQNHQKCQNGQNIQTKGSI